MTKEDLVDVIRAKLELRKQETAEAVEVVFDVVKETLERGENIKISGFGTFVVRVKNKRMGRNPQTGEIIEISARRVLLFHGSQLLKNALNAPGAADKRADIET